MTGSLKPWPTKRFTNIIFRSFFRSWTDAVVMAFENTT